jgi:hypothetical protein
VAVVQDTPLLSASIAANQRNLQIFGKLGTNYQVQFRTNLTVLSGWQPLLDYAQTNGVINLGVESTNPAIFYRLLQK